MRTDVAKKRFTVDEYYRMAEVGILKNGDRTELIDGEVIPMGAMNLPHWAAVACASDFLVPLFKGKALVAVQLPLRLNEYNAPQPDICLLKPQRDFYRSRYAAPADVFLIIEIADTSLPFDREVKLPLYAATRIPEFWIEDLTTDTLHVFRNPSRGAYKTSAAFRRGDSVSPLTFPDVGFSVDALLGPDR